MPNPTPHEHFYQRPVRTASFLAGQDFERAVSWQLPGRQKMTGCSSCTSTISGCRFARCSGEPPLSCRFTGGYLLPYRFLFTFVRAVIADSFRDEPLSTLTMRFRLDTCTFPSPPIAARKKTVKQLSAVQRWAAHLRHPLWSADRVRRKQRMNAPELVRHLRDPQVAHRAGQCQRRCL